MDDIDTPCFSLPAPGLRRGVYYVIVYRKKTNMFVWQGGANDTNSPRSTPEDYPVRSAPTFVSSMSSGQHKRVLLDFHVLYLLILKFFKILAHPFFLGKTP